MTPRIFFVSIIFWIILPGSSLRAQSSPAPETRGASLIVVAGAPGEAEYGDAFARWSANWQKAGAAAGIKTQAIGAATGGEDDLARLRAALKQEATSGSDALWLVLLGHGSYAGGEAKFNLRGADISAKELAEMLAPFAQRPVVLVAAFSASGAFLPVLSKPGRVIVTASRTGAENNYSRMGQYFSEAIADPTADLDHDGQTSVLEAWVSAAGRVADFYKSEGRLATEHSLLDDNGDGRGTPADWFNGVRLVKKPTGKAAPDGQRAHQICLLPSAAERALSPAARAQRDALEVELTRLRDTKPSVPEAEYYQRLEAILLQIARLYPEKESAEKR